MHILLIETRVLRDSFSLNKIKPENDKIQPKTGRFFTEIEFRNVLLK